jgi:hypothetical protein
MYAGIMLATASMPNIRLILRRKYEKLLLNKQKYNPKIVEI